MIEAKLLRKKLKNGLIVDKWDLVTIIEKQQAEIEALKKEAALQRLSDFTQEAESFDRTASHMAGEYVSWTSCVACGQRVTGDSIHTCSPQLKQLTDEEIGQFKGEWYRGDYASFYDLVRAILRKASEK